ncbi:hypothetical protein TRFO_41280 [Tritrichomonas foetus]|uniref:Uncharacterized protein n=1 Tax=Tritrichomonas foetus TaxID=1144522 RepID=A0A1J4L109_9EUKA|nr:hypothetical protein TRFO_41280 [Tritrichomonas foetus]|eukprot:OHT17098.1 hypothetical protein TRFO_41280 [Tritrichomonas foetus]
MFFFFLLFPFLILGKLPPDEHICLQTYYVDQIGRADINFQVAFFGISLEGAGYNETEIVLSNRNAIKMASPLWFHFIDNHYHYLPFKRAVFNFSHFAKFSPKSLFIPSVNFLTLRPIIFNITNIHQTDNLYISEAYTTSCNVILEQFQPRYLKPDETLSITIYICPTEPAPASAIIMVVTSSGTLPYYVAYKPIITQKDFAHQMIYHQCLVQKTNFTVRTPPTINSRIISVIYDSILFDPFRSSAERKFIHFALQPINSGTYFSFMTFVCHNDMVKVLPFFLIVSTKFLQPYYPILLIDMVTSPTETAEADIKLVNPTHLQFTIISATLDKNAPSNIKVELHSHPIICTRNSYVVIGKVVVSGAKQGDINTVLTINYEGNVESRITQSIDLHVRGCVMYGSLEPSEPRVNLLQTSQDLHRIHFTNHFPVPVVIISARTDSTLFRVQGFTPSIVQPGCVSEDIIVKFTYKMATSSFETILTVETNATNHQIPISGYNGQLTIATSNATISSDTHIFKSLGKVLVSSTTNFTFYIRNPNPVGYVMSDYNATPGIVVNGFWLGNESAPLRDHQMLPYSTEQINLFVGFNKVQHNKPRNDTISIGTPDSYVQITLQWTPMNGGFYITANLPGVLIFGCTYKTEIFVNSSYSVSLKLRNLTTNVPIFNLYTNAPFIRSGVVTIIGNASFTLTTEMFRNTRISAIFNSSLSWVAQKRKWNKLWASQLVYEIPISLVFKGNSYVRSILQLTIIPPIFPDLRYNYGYILPYCEMHGHIVHHNFLNTSVTYRFHSIDNAKSDYETAISPPNSDITFNFTLIATKIGVNFYKIPITTNASHPFFIMIKAEVVTPNVLFVDYFGEKIDTIQFHAEDDFRKTVWAKSVYLQNNGKTDVEIGQFFVRSKMFKISRACDKIIRQNETCRVDIHALLKHLKNQTEESNLSLYVHGLRLTCKISVTLGDKAMRKLEIIRTINFIIVIIIALLFPIYDIYTYYKKLSKLYNDLEIRFANFHAEVDKLSVSMKSSIATQAVIKHEEVSMGSWIQASEVHQYITSEAIESLEEILNNIT